MLPYLSNHENATDAMQKECLSDRTPYRCRKGKRESGTWKYARIENGSDDEMSRSEMTTLV